MLKDHYTLIFTRNNNAKRSLNTDFTSNNAKRSLNSDIYKKR